MKTISTEIQTERQAVCYKELLEHNSRKLRVSVKSDSYASQCHAHIDLFDGDKWNRLDYIHFSKMATPPELAYTQGRISNHTFKEDRDKLVKIAIELLSDSI